jgi:Dyp-type peroxidase family
MTDLTKTGIDQKDLAYRDLFSNLQGNILKAHGRNHTNNIFLQFKTNQQVEVKKWIKQFAEDKITSCKKQLKEIDLFKRNHVSGETFYNLYLSAEGYNYLGFDPSKFSDPSFKKGMKNADLKDPIKDDWETGFNNTIHAMILIADTDEVPNTLSKAAKAILKEIETFAEILTIEYGNAIRNANGDGLEHFGYVDGISQPLFFKDELDENKANSTANLKFDPKASVDLVLINDPFVHGQDAFGSYFVFRKLEPHVRSFKKAEKELAHQIGLTGDDIERAGAMLVGRFEDGTPVTLSNEPDIIGSGNLNNFDYSNDLKGSKCPFHAHIRKSNPRRNDDDKTHIMARRGITYGQRNVSTEIDPLPQQMPENGVGLLFMSFQRSIVNQFEFIQKNWVNNPGFPNQNDGIDPLIGQDGVENISTGHFPKEFGLMSDSNMRKKSFNSFVTLKGGEYFFAPSIAFLKNIIPQEV